VWRVAEIIGRHRPPPFERRDVFRIEGPRRTSVSNIGSLYAFIDNGAAPVIAARAASRAGCSCTGFPVNEASAALARCGTGAADPSTIDTFVQRPFGYRSSKTATSAIGQSNEPFSPCFKCADFALDASFGDTMADSSSPGLRLFSRVISLSGSRKNYSSGITRRAPSGCASSTPAPQTFTPLARHLDEIMPMQ